MTATITRTQLENAALDAASLAAVVNNASGTVTTRTGRVIYTLAALSAMAEEALDGVGVFTNWDFAVGHTSVDDGHFVGFGNPSPEAAVHVGPASLSAEGDPGIGLARTLTNTVSGSAHGYVELTTIDRNSGGPVGYAAYDAWSKFIGTYNYDHMAGYQCRIAHQGNGTVDNMYCAYLTGTILTPASGSAGTVTNGYGLYVGGFSAGFGTLPNSYGIYVGSIASASTLNYSLFLDGDGTSGIVRMKPRVGVGTADVGTNRQFQVTTTLAVGGWSSNIWAVAAAAPSIRLFATGGDKWSGFGNDNDGSIHFLVGASTGTGSPTVAGNFGPTGGLTLGSATGGDKGTGKINVAGDIYKNNTAYNNPDYVLEHWATGAIVRFKDRDGADRYDGLWALPDVEAFTREHLVLPRIHQAREAANDTGLGLFGGGDALLATVEEGFLYLFDHETRISALEQKQAA